MFIITIGLHLCNVFLSLISQAHQSRGKVSCSLLRNMACDSPAWAHGLTANNLNYEDVIEGEMLEKLLELHKRDTLVPLGPVPVAEQQQVIQLRYRIRVGWSAT